MSFKEASDKKSISDSIIQTIINQISEGVIIHNRDRIISFFNTQAARITGYEIEDVLGKDCHLVFPAKLCGRKCCFCAGEFPIFDQATFPLKIFAKDGSIKSINMTVNILKDDQGTVLGFVGIFKEIKNLKPNKDEVEQRYCLEAIVGNDEAMLKIRELVRQYAGTDINILIEGEKGTGKEFLARVIHQESLYAEKSFIIIPASSLGEKALEQRLFGIKEDIKVSKSVFEEVEGGTIYIDEIGSLNPFCQQKLLAVLLKKLEKNSTDAKLNFRLICGTSVDLANAVVSGKFSEELYKKISEVKIRIPPLKERRGYIPLWVELFLKDEQKNRNVENFSVSAEAMALLSGYDYPGNLDELKNILTAGIIRSKGNTLKAEDLIIERAVPLVLDEPHRKRAFVPRRRKLNMEAVKSALKETGGNKARAARLLKVGRATLYRFLEDQKLSRDT